MNVGDVMTQEVISAGPGITVTEAAALMLKERISGLPVINDSHVLIGIVTEGDLLRRTEITTERKRPHWLEFITNPATLASEYVHTHGRKVSDVMTPHVAVATEDMPLEAAVSLMEKHKVKRLPVLRGGRVVGILTRANLLRALAALPPTRGGSQEDRVIREQIIWELSKHAWNARDGQVTVKDGHVALWGFITNERQRAAIHVVVENVPGVKRLHDHLSLYEPFSGIVISQGLDGGTQ